MSTKFHLQSIPFEAAIWTAGLLGLALMGPSLEGHFTICIPSLLGFDGCWGCGLGRSVSHALHGDLAGSWTSHPLGIFALTVIVIRIASLVLRTTNHQPQTTDHQPQTTNHRGNHG
jgi:hypothetical protein